MIEIPPKFAGRPPVNPDAQKGKLNIKTWRGAQGLAEDVRCYGRWMRDEAEKRIGHLYPKIEITAAMAQERPDLKPLVGRQLTVIAWLWARTVKSPNPAFRNVDVPLASTFMLSTKPGKEAWVEPVIEDGGYRFTVKVGEPPNDGSEAGGLPKMPPRALKRITWDEPDLTDEYLEEVRAEYEVLQRDCREMTDEQLCARFDWGAFSEDRRAAVRAHRKALQNRPFEVWKGDSGHRNCWLLHGSAELAEKYGYRDVDCQMALASSFYFSQSSWSRTLEYWLLL